MKFPVMIQTSIVLIPVITKHFLKIYNLVKIYEKKIYEKILRQCPDKVYFWNLFFQKNVRHYFILFSDRILISPQIS